MTDSMKCPICGTPLEYDIGYDGDYSCAKCGRAKMFGSEELWQELIRTRKALDIAVDTLKYIRRTNPISFHFEAIEKALEQIRALEQED